MLFENIRADINENAKWSTSPTFKGKIMLLLDAGFHAVLTYRFGCFAHNLKIPVVRQLLLLVHTLMHFLVHMTSGIDIAKEAKIGKGLVIHSFSSVLISNVEMGEYCVISPNVYLAGRKDGIPKVGDHVFFGLGSRILGNVTIGDYAIIGAASLVIKDVPADHTAIGVDNLRIFPNRIPRGDRFRVV